MLVRTTCWLVAAGLLLSGCGLSRVSVRDADADGVGPVKLVTGEDLTGYLRGRLQVWNAGHPRQKATVLELPAAADEARSQMISNLQAKSDRYDVLNLDVVWTSEFAANGWITPINPSEFPLDEFLKQTVATAGYHGELYAVPYVTNAGLLYYRKDILDREHLAPPRTWADLERLAMTVARRNGVNGYAGQFLPYEGLTVNYAEAVQSAGGEILSDHGTKAAVDSPMARQALSFLVRGVREGWIPQETLTFDEEGSRKAFQDGRYLFLRNWPYVYGLAEAEHSKIAGKFGVTELPGPNGPGISSLGGSNLAISSYSRHKKTARKLIQFLTSLDNERQVLIRGLLPPVWSQLYTDPELVRRFPYLPVLRQSILSAKPRPMTPAYAQVGLAIAAAVHDALGQRQSPDMTAARLERELNAIIRGP